MKKNMPQGPARCIISRTGMSASHRASGLFNQTFRIASAILMMAFSAGYTSATETKNMDGMQICRMERTQKLDTKLDYLLYLPGTNSAPEEAWPLMLFLHGAGERGDDLEKVKAHGPPRLIAEGRELPFIIAAPQCPEGISWSNPEMILALNGLVDELIANHPVDESRIYLTGLSMGGFGAWHYALRDPGRFAALVPIAGGHQPGSDAVPADICALQDTPVWVFHGLLDDVVPAWQSGILVDALRACPAEVKLTLYAEADHDDAWKRAYNDPALYEWLLAQQLGP